MSGRVATRDLFANVFRRCYGELPEARVHFAEGTREEIGWKEKTSWARFIVAQTRDGSWWFGLSASFAGVSSGCCGFASPTTDGPYITRADAVRAARAALWKRLFPIKGKDADKARRWLKGLQQ